jgi:flagellar biosynthesis chaperone FliJ
MKDIEREYAVAQGELADAFQELKSLEIAAEQQQRRVTELQGRRAQTRMDEIALIRHLRKHAVRTASR